LLRDPQRGGGAGDRPMPAHLAQRAQRAEVVYGTAVVAGAAVVAGGLCHNPELYPHKAVRLLQPRVSAEPGRAMTTTPFPAERASVTAARPRDRGRPGTARARALFGELAPGLAAALGLGVVATVIGKNVPLVGSAVPGAVLGALVAIIRPRGVRGAVS